jgi:hypothetical protein
LLLTACEPRRRLARFHARKGADDSGGDAKERLLSLYSTVEPLLDGVAGFLPSSVPRPLARTIAGVLLGGFLLLVLRSLLSTLWSLFALGLFGAFAWTVFASRQSDASSSVEDEQASSAPVAEEDDDPVERARKIMDKYK